MTVPQLPPDLLGSGWRESLRQALKSRGFTSATDYIESQPEMSLSELVSELHVPPTAAMQLRLLYIEEAEASNPIERCARSLLALALRSELPEGWPGDGRDGADGSAPLLRRAAVFRSLSLALSEACALAVERIRQTMEAADIPVGWVPTGADDPVLVEVFSHWISTPP